MADLPAVSVLVVNYNAGDELVECLETVRAQRYDRPVEFVVVDNASADDSLARARERFPDLIVVANKENAGYARAMNQALAASRGPVVLALNFDVRLEPDFLAEAVRGIESDPRIGSVSGKLVRQWDEDVRLIDSAGISFHHMFPTDRGQGKRDIGQYDHPEEIFGASGAAALYRREMLEAIAVDGEVFDEDFFMVVEDVDVAWRAQNAGWRCLYCPAARALHRRGTTWRGDRRGRGRYYFWGNRNRYLTILKNLDPATRRVHKPDIRRQELRHLARAWKHYGAATAIGSVLSALRRRHRMRAKGKATLPKDESARRRVERFIYF
jgi:GT2 family glycosyltransferase